MRRRTRDFSLTSSAAGLLLLLAPSVASAQSDTEPPLPNVMLLIDTSGSMEYMPGVEKDPTTGALKARLPKCATSAADIKSNVVYEQNRWTSLATVLTGEIPRYACVAEQRSTPAFKKEFGELLGNGTYALYDGDYYLPYNRIVSTNTANSQACVVGPNRAKWPGSNPFAFGTDAITTHLVGDPSTTCAAVGGAQRIQQVDDGLLDVFREKARFGLMTFDGLPDPRTGYAGNNADTVGGMQGLWSYYPGWLSNDVTYAKGLPAGCTTGLQTIEVGARNPAAPPWEGRLINFGPSTASLSSVLARNEQIQQAILAVRPYGATPMAGMLTDAEYFFFKDTSLDKAEAGSVDFGPYNDPYVQGGCRKQFIILLTDGIPNLDLRESCGQVGGVCPFGTPSEIARRLYINNPTRPVQTFVVGFAVSSAKTGDPLPLDCKTLTGDNDAACASPKTDEVRACCEMAKIAYNGGTKVPRFADSKPELRKAINDILSQVAQSTTSRTTPVFASVGAAGGGYSGGDNKIAAYNILTSFKVSTGGLWEGVIERQRYTCRKSAGVYNVKAEDISTNDGDRFQQNLKSGSGPERQFFSGVASGGSNPSNARQTLRNPNNLTDGLGPVQFKQVKGALSAFYNTMPADSLQLASANGSLSVCGSIKTPVSENACRDRILRWFTGMPMVDGSLYDRVNAPLGSIYHSTPTVVGPPTEYVRDDSYSSFANTYKNRTPLAYMSTTDGQLHAFKLGPSSAADTAKVDSTNNNEVWSFIPPAVLPDLKSIYPGIERRLLDIPVVARDVVFERKRSDAVSGSASFNAWRTVLTTGFGPSLGGYFALDVTDPDPGNPVVPPASNAGPRFLWQLIGDSNNFPLFGRSSTPIITTVFVKAPNASEPTEIAVAILPGGGSPNALSGAEVARRTAGVKTTDGKWAFRDKIRQYSDDDPSRSVTIVRLDTGEVLQRFHRCKTNSQPPYPYDSSLLSRSKCADFDSPITGVPLAYPNGTGQAATRAFVGDQDGTLWRIDMSNPDPTTWTVKQFFDGYTYTTSGTEGQPILSQPVASLDPLGNLVVVFSTGEQDRFDSSPGVRNVLWSVRESPDFATGVVGSVANWHLGINTNEQIDAQPSGSANGDWNNGIRVAGPLSLFNGAVYFSTYRPPAPGVNACDPGTSVLWAVDYLKNKLSDPFGNSAPAAALANGNQLVHAKEYANALIFGVGIQKLPACYDTTSISDPYLGFGTGSTSVSDMTKPEYNLVVQTGAKGVNNANAETKFERIQLQPPPSAARISSWASVVE